MRVLVLHRPSGLLGGDTGMARSYAVALDQIGVDAELRPANALHVLESFDFVHMFAAVSPDWGLPAATRVKQAGARLIISPIWWTRRPRLDYYGLGNDVAPGYTQAVAQTMALADALAVYTMSEAVQVWQLLPRKQVHVMGVGHDGTKTKRQDAEDYVITIGRIEKHKNQVNLALACKDLGCELRCIGPVADEPYAAKVRALGGLVMGGRSHEETMQHLARARVYALPSWSENVSVATCEAAGLHIPAVLSWIGCEPEFFGNGPLYCNPADWRDIRDAVATAWQQPRRQWADIPTWKSVAEGMASYMGQWLTQEGRREG